MSSPDPVLDALLLRRIAELGPLGAAGIELQAGGSGRIGVEEFGLDDAELWAQARVADGLLEPAEGNAQAWQITDAGRALIEDPPG
jgi:hypothetical protein